MYNGIQLNYKKLRLDLRNILGFQTDLKIIVFESDDWGSIRMPSLASFHELEKFGIDLRSSDAQRYNLNDSLATGQDLECLFDILSRFKDINGNNAVFTPMTIVANPDFDKIKESNFCEYHYEPFTSTLKRYSNCQGSFELWKEGIRDRLFMPQLHGREHLNVCAWIRALNINEKQTRKAFEEGVWGFVPDSLSLPNIDFQSAFSFDNPSELEYHKIVINDGVALFKDLFGYSAEYFVPPNGSFNNILNKTLAENGIKFRSVSKIQSEPLGNGKNRKIVHWLGEREKNGIQYIIRNCFFEPSLSGRDWVDSCMNEISYAFRWKKPAIIGTHRVNYVSSLNLTNRENGLVQLKKLLNEIIKNWPDITFMATPELGNLMRRRK